MTRRCRLLLVALAAPFVVGVSVKRVVVAGDSMFPAFLPGDRLVACRGVPLRAGRVVALRDPRDGSRLLVKRIAAVSEAGLDVRGDNTAASTDSRTFGPVPADRIVGTVVYRYAPAWRVGWWPGSSRG